MTDQPVRHEVMDPVVLWLDSQVGTGNDFHVRDVVEGLAQEGFDFATIQVQRAVYYLQRTMGLAEPDANGFAGWFTWTGTLDEYEARRNLRGNNARWVAADPDLEV